MRFRFVALALVLFAAAAAPVGAQEDETPPKEKNEYRGGAVRLGVFNVFNISTAAGVKSQSFPLGLYIDLTKDLGVSDSATVPRAFFSYRFNRRRQVDFDWYRLKRDAFHRLERDISIGPIDIPIGIQVEAFSDITIYKGVYTWFFHDDPKVSLGLSVGLNVFDFLLGVDAGPDNIGDDNFSERAGITAPLPVLGGRMIYRVSPRVGVLFTADVLMVKIGDYSGTFQDVYAIAEYRLSKRFGIGGGLNVLGLNVEIDNDEKLGKVDHRLTGVIVHGTVYF